MNQICKTFFYILRLPCDKTSGSPQQWGVQPDHGLPSTFLPRAFPTHTLVIISIIYLHNGFIIVRIILDVIIIIVRVTMNNGNSRSPLRWVGASGCFYFWKKGLEEANITLCASTCWPSSQNHISEIWSREVFAQIYKRTFDVVLEVVSLEAQLFWHVDATKLIRNMT